MGRIISLPNEKKTAGLLLLACATLYFLPLNLRDLWDPIEGRFAEVAREMWVTKDWIVPHLNYVPYLEKPPAIYWLTSITFGLLGLNSFAARFWSAAFGVGTVLLTYRIGRSWKNEWVGLLAGGMLATSLGFYAFTQIISADMAFTFWMTLALLSAARLLIERSVSLARRSTYVFAIAIAAGIMTGGLRALVYPLSAVLAVSLSQGRRRSMPKLPWKGALILCMVLALPWFLSISFRFPSFPAFYFLQRPFDVKGFSHPVYFFIPVALLAFVPWCLFLPKVISTWFSHRYAVLQRDAEGALLVTWICLIFVFITLIPQKEVGSILPVLPAFALLLANEFDLDSEEMPDWFGGGLGILMGVFFILLVGFKIAAMQGIVITPILKAIIAESDLLILLLGMAIFVLVGIWGMRNTPKALAGLMLIQVCLLSVASSLMPALNPYLSTHGLAKRFMSRASSSQLLVALGDTYDQRMHTLPFYTERRVPIWGDSKDLAFGRAYDSDPNPWFVSDAQIESALATAGPETWFVTDLDRWQGIKRKTPDAFDLLHQSGSLVLIGPKTN